MIKRIFIAVCLINICISGYSQTNLLPGDIAFIGINSDNATDDFSFVALAPLAQGTQINFTDCGWNLTGFNTVETESHIMWTATEAISEGTVVTLSTFNGNTMPTANIGTVTGDKMLISIAGDQIFAYQGTKANPQFIAAISFNQNNTAQPGNNFDGAAISNSTTALPRGLTMNQDAIHVYNNLNFSEQDNSRYKGTVTSGTKLELLKAINNRNNWETNDETNFTLSPFPKSFIVNASSLAVSKSTVTLANTESNTSINVISNTVWSVKTSESWLTCNVSTGSENSSIILTATANNTAASRTGTITVEASGVSPKTIEVTQLAGTTTGIDHIDDKNIKVYPTKTSTGFFIETTEKEGTVNIYNVSGILVYQHKLNNSKNYIDISNWRKGIYLIKLEGFLEKICKQ